MKKLLRLISIYLTAIVLICTMVGCSFERQDKKLPKLDTPVVTIDNDGIATWDEVDNAQYYVYVIDEGEEHLTLDCSAAVEYNQSIKVKAVSGVAEYDDSEFSRYKAYTEIPAEKQTLATPIVTIDADGIATWSSVQGAVSYIYVIDGGEEASTTLRSVKLSDGQNVKVKAVAGSDEYLDSDYSTVKTYVKVAVQTKLATPTVTIDSNGIATWGSITNAQSYIYIIDSGAEKTTTVRTVTLTDKQSIKVKAVAGSSEYLDSDYSAVKTYTKQGGNGDDKPIVGPVLSETVKAYYKPITATSGNSLLGQVHDLITETHTYYTTYGECSESKYVNVTDPGPNGGAREFYTQNSIMSFSGSVGDWNREHVWCKSLSNGMWKSVSNSTRNGGSDMHHIRPAECGLNSTRGSKKFGEVSNGAAVWSRNSSKNNVAIGGYTSGSTFEPLDQVKGDVARIVLYVYVHYNTYANVYGTTNGKGGAFGTLNFTHIMAANSESSAIQMLIKWSKDDPVDDIEITRNNEVYKIQGNRNPFIDHPEYVTAIWG